MKKFLIIVITVLAIFPFTVTTAFAAKNFHNTNPIDPEKSGISDNYGLFGENDIDTLNKLIQEKADKLDMNILVFVAGNECKNFLDSDTESFSADKYDETYGIDTDGVFYFMDLSGKQPAYDYISTSGKAVLVYQNHIQSIHRACQALLPPSSVTDYSVYKEDIAQAIETFLEQLDKFYREKQAGYYYDKYSDKYFYYKGSELVISNRPPLYMQMIPLIFALPIGIISAIIFYFVNKSKYKFKSSVNPVTYVSHDETQFIHKDDRFIRTYTTKTKIETNNSSGSSHSSGGGGNSHGGGHGGGGSHR